MTVLAYMRRVLGVICSAGFLGLFLVAELWVMFQSTSFGNWETQGVWANQTEEAALFSAASSEGSFTEVSGRVVIEDSRSLLLRAYLEKYHSPLLPYWQKIFDLSVERGFDYRWIVAIAQQESNLCKKIPDNSFNCWGYGIHSRGTMRFASYDEALLSFADYLKREYFDLGLITPEQVMEKYAPFSQGSWAFGVGQFMDEIEIQK